MCSKPKAWTSMPPQAPSVLGPIEDRVLTIAGTEAGCWGRGRRRSCTGCAHSSKQGAEAPCSSGAAGASCHALQQFKPSVERPYLVGYPVSVK